MRPLPRSLAWAPRLALPLTVGACAFLDPMSQAGLGVLLTPRDTTLYVGAQFQARGLMVNSYGDQYSSTRLRFAGVDSSASVDVGGTVTGLGYGRARIVVTRADLADTGWVSVVPTGALAVAASGGVHVVNTDGSADRLVASYGTYSGGPSAWIPGGTGILYQYADPTGQDSMSIMAVDLAGGAPQLVAHGMNPRVSADGAWVYYQKPREYSGSDLWRVHLDGTGPERITSGGVYPDPSPDGTQVAFAYASSGGEPAVAIRTLATGEERVLAASGRYPRWSPSGTRIAFWRLSAANSSDYAGEIVVVSADGTEPRVVSAPGRLYVVDAIDWSPDGQWLVAHTYDDWDLNNPLDLIHVATGLTLPLGYSGTYHLASWRR